MSAVELRQHSALARLSVPRQLDVHGRVDTLWNDDAKACAILGDLFTAGGETARQIVQAIREGDEPKAQALLFAAIDDEHTAAAIEEVEDDDFEAMLADPGFDPLPFPTPRSSASQDRSPTVEQAGAATSLVPTGSAATGRGAVGGCASQLGAAA